MLPVRILLRAIKERDEAIAWYLNQAPVEIAIRFWDRIDEMLAHISEHPHIGAPQANGTRQYPMQAFPYVLIFVVEPTEIVVLSIFQTDQSPSRQPLA
jgi:plasmid stabilization system protein ParE